MQSKKSLTNILKINFKNFLVTSCWILISVPLFSQTGIIKGRVSNKLNNEAISFAIIQIIDTEKGAETDDNGDYEIVGLNPGLYKIKASIVGFKEAEVFEIQVTNAKPTEINFELEELTSDIQEVVIKASPFKKTEESPVSLRTIGVSEIARNPGGNRDISKVIQSLPGVTALPTFRNDLIIRGGGPNENRFYIDDIETPVINHFSTQGASGGPVGMLNVTLLKEVDFYSGAFPANRGNSLSSVFNFRMKDGAADRWRFTGTAGSSDFGLTAEGPVNNKTTFLLSVRRSYLQFLFKAIGLPFLPTYNDLQMKVKYKVNDKNEITYTILGAYDQFVLDTTARKDESSAYLLDNLPISPQWNYTNGITWKRFDNTGYWTFVASRNMLNNESYKYKDNIEAKGKIFDYSSQEIENKLRAERTTRIGNWKFLYGIGYEFVKYNNSTFQARNVGNGIVTIDYNSTFNMNKYSCFAQISRKFNNEKLVVSLGSRFDGNNYNDNMKNPFKQISPRISIALALTPQLAANFNTGIFYQLPPYPSFGFKQNDVFINKDNLKYIRSSHLVGGLEYNTKTDTKFSIEGYFKKYNNYPFLLREQVTLANLGGDFGVVGNEASTSTSSGRTYGIELLAQQRFYKGFYGILAYTLGRSEFEDKDKNLVPSAWDSRHTAVATLGYQLKKNWEIGIKFRAASGVPYTPNAPQSDIVEIWDALGQAIPDYANQLNAKRTNGFSTFDFRVDKKWYGKKVTWNLYFDIQNATGANVTKPLQLLDRPLDANLKPIGNAEIFTDANGVKRYKTKFIEDGNGFATPSIGLQIEF
jgi:hypothetical protein